MAGDRQGTDELSANLALVAERYDELPYNSQPFSRTHPLRLAGIARLFGHEAPAMAKARVLELGCAAGGNIIPMAALYPEAQFLGVDLGRRQVEDAHERITRLGLTNIEIRCQSITDLPEDAGAFDYIISHGVYSWVPAPVREALLEVTARHLSPTGIAYVSYNVAPGWHLYQPLRDAFRLLIPEQLGPAERVRMARDLMVFLKQHSPDLGPYGAMLRDTPARLADLGDDYIFHEYMEDTNDPSSFRDFAMAGDKQGLAYLADSELDYLLPENFGPEFAKQLREKTSDDMISVEQMIDVLTGRPFRRSLLVHKTLADDLKRGLSPECVERLHFMASDGMQISRDGTAVTLTNSSGRTLTSHETPVAKALERLLAAYPGTISFDECAKGFRGRERFLVSDALYKLVIAGILDVASEPIRIGQVSDRPRAFRVARDDAARGEGMTVNLRHDRVIIDPVAKILLPALDGASDRAALESLLFNAARTGRLKFGRNGAAETNSDVLRVAVREILPEALRGLAASGVLLP